MLWGARRTPAPASAATQDRARKLAACHRNLTLPLPLPLPLLTPPPLVSGVGGLLDILFEELPRRVCRLCGLWLAHHPAHQGAEAPRGGGKQPGPVGRLPASQPASLPRLPARAARISQPD